MVVINTDKRAFADAVASIIGTDSKNAVKQEIKDEKKIKEDDEEIKEEIKMDVDVNIDVENSETLSAPETSELKQENDPVSVTLIITRA